AEAVELGADLADLAGKEVVVVDDAVLPVGPAGRPAGDGQAEVALARQRHAVLVDPAEGVGLPLADEAAGRRPPVGGGGGWAAPRGSPAPHSEGHHTGPMGVSGPSLAGFSAGFCAGPLQGTSERPRASSTGRVCLRVMAVLLAANGTTVACKDALPAPLFQAG